LDDESDTIGGKPQEKAPYTEASYWQGCLLAWTKEREALDLDLDLDPVVTRTSESGEKQTAKLLDIWTTNKHTSGFPQLPLFLGIEIVREVLIRRS